MAFINLKEKVNVIFRDTFHIKPFMVWILSREKAFAYNIPEGISYN